MSRLCNAFEAAHVFAVYLIRYRTNRSVTKTARESNENYMEMQSINT